jgi:hypothetical protein
MKNVTKPLACLALTVASLSFFSGCEANKGPAEKAGEKVDRAIQGGPAEKAGRAVDNATSK